MPGVVVVPYSGVEVVCSTDEVLVSADVVSVVGAVLVSVDPVLP